MKSRLILISLVLLLSGCAAKQRTVQPARGVEVERLTVEQVALEEVLATPTQFPVTYSEDSYAWSRAKIFFDDNVLKKVESKSKDPNGRPKLSIRSVQSGAERYVYRVDRSERKDGYNYRVRCVPVAGRGTNQTAKQNAQNLARFIKDGTLESSLIVR